MSEHGEFVSALPVDIETKRRLVREQLDYMVGEHDAIVEKELAFVRYLRFRMLLVGGMPEIELDLLLEDWLSERVARSTRGNAIRHLEQIAKTIWPEEAP